ncbi:MFS general substrate transporter [Microstroma glucosiphilum]|uniref:MFS general substrate transporter n=1 Tax=Pseudomicrostroma glucosiphilum TaxID=1684307 RepID=A0A316U6R5_9BASI|nr:MFS general substrate transporter [Pseudomicrostroma glucosiphilum]PWN20967.1 MFS general substrate transporter [Pseudomicrostroma glucosiphilum]
MEVTPPAPSHRLNTVFFPRFYSEKVTPILMIAAVTGSTVLASYVNGALTIALPSIGRQLGFGGTDLQWPLTLFSLLNGSFLLICGGLADVLGRRFIFFIGVVWLCVCGIGITFAKTPIFFIVFAALMGLGCAILSPAATGLLSALPEGRLRNLSYSALGAGQPLGFVLGLLAGGLLSEDWRTIMYLMAGCAVLFIAISIVSLPADEPTQHNERSPIQQLLHFDWLGAVMSTSGLVLLTFGLADAGSSARGWKSPFVPATLPLSLLLLVSFLFWENKVEKAHLRGPGMSLGQSNATPRNLRALTNLSGTMAPLLPHSIWRAKALKPLLSMIFFAWLSFNSLSYFATLYIQEVRQLSPLQASLQFLPMVVTGILYNVIAGLMMSKFSGLWLIIPGILGGIASCVIFCVIGKDTVYWAGLFISFCLAPSTDLVFPVAQLYACSSAGPSRAALAGGLFNTTTRLATSLGLAITASISSAVTKKYVQANAEEVSSTSPEALLQGYHAAIWFCVACSGLAMLIACIWLRDIGIVGFDEGGSDKKTDVAIAAASVPSANAVAGAIAGAAADLAPSTSDSKSFRGFGAGDGTEEGFELGALPARAVITSRSRQGGEGSSYRYDAKGKGKGCVELGELRPVKSDGWD